MISNVHPNPSTNGLFHVSVEGMKYNSPVTLEILDMVGKVVLTQPNFESNTTIDISTFENGVYFVRITNGAMYVVEKIVYQ